MGERKKDFVWRYQPNLSSDKAKMLTYIQNRDLHPSQDKTAMIMAALTAYYMPLALHSQGSCPRESLELILLDSATAFVNQLKYVCTALNVDPARVGNVLCSAFQIPLFFQSTQAESIYTDSTLELDNLNDFDLNTWNLAGITTDSETFN
ncbi:hypothetical protein H6G66_29435 [Fischerella sp. FACHB-380]|nr:hypothetical protein [Fischerella sp. FACHB-380]MBD2435079.1 hypothetical protein [Fischerella sp. FACHB-380]